MVEDDLCFVFTHIPKTAGSTFRQILSRNFSRTETLMLEGRKNTAELSRLYSMSDSELSKYRLIAGHVPHGLHHRLNCKVQYLTVLRDPVEKVISNYLYILNTPTHYRYRTLTNWSGGGVMPFEVFVTDFSTGQLQDQMVRLLSCDDARHNHAGVGSNELETAKTRLQNDYVFGLQEHFDYFLLLLQKQLGFEAISYQRANTTMRRLHDVTITERDRQIARSVNALDTELYEYALKSFFRTVSEWGISEDDLARFRNQQQAVSRAKQIYLGARGRLKEFSYRLVAYYKRR